jgi:hypothetical protein
MYQLVFIHQAVLPDSLISGLSDAELRLTRVMPFVRRTAVLLLCIALSGTLQAQIAQYGYDDSGGLITRTIDNLAPPQIVRQPQARIVAPGELASFSVLLSDTRALSFQWRFNGTNLPGRTNDALLLRNISTNNQGSYDVVVTNISGSVTSNPATLYIDSDGDGLPDSWEQTYFGNLTGQRGGGDADGDGVSNLNEFFDGTNPTNSASKNLRLTILADGGSVAMVPTKLYYTNGELVTLTATPFPPNTFRSWTGDLLSHSNPAALTMNISKTVRAHFKCAPAPTGIVAWWRGENDTLDALGAHPGLLSNGLSFAEGQVGQAFRFTGTNQEVMIPASPILNLGAGSGLTIEAWIKPSDLVTQLPLVEWNDGTNVGAHMWLNVAFSGLGGPGCFYANLRDVNSADHFFFTPINLLTTNVWQHVALTYDRASGIAKLFLDGFAVATVNLGSLVPRTTADLHLGFRPGYRSYSGLLDEPAIYNRALTPSEVLDLYLADAAGKCDDRPLFTSSFQLADAVQGANYAQQMTTAFGVLPVSFSLSAGSLPPGLTLSSSGLVNGVPTLPGSNVFAVLATDAAGSASELVCGLEVLPTDTPVMPGGLLAWWRAENNARDSIGTNDGTMLNGATFAAGKVGSAFSFDGVGGAVAIPNSSWMNPTGAFSVEAWIKASRQQFSADQYFLVVDKSHACGDGTGWVLLGTPNGTMEFAFGKGGSPGAASFPNVISSSSVLDDQWHHVVGVFTGSQLAIYQDGVLANAVGVSDFPAPNSRDVEIGRWCGSFDRAFHGLIDEVSYYNRALTDAEIAGLYRADAAGKIVAGPYLNTPSLPDAFVGQGYAQTITSVRALAPVTYAIIAGQAPSGLSLNPSGLLSGTPVNAGTFNFTIRATDAAALSNSQSFTLQVYAQIPPPPGIVSWWRAETNALDSVGTNHGSLHGGATFAPGKVGQAFLFDGADDAIEFPDAPTLRPASLTLETWIQFTGAPGNRVIFAKPLGSGTLDSYALVLYNGTLNAAVADASGFGPTLTVEFSPSASSWHHVAFTFDDASKQETMYLDGAQVASGIANKTIAYDNQPLFLGRDTDNGSPAYFFPGRIDEAALYHRALSATEIASLYHAGSAGKSPQGPYFTTPPELPDAVVGKDYSQTIAVEGGTTPVTLMLLSNPVPAGLTLNASGLLGGSATAAGNFSITVRATDRTGKVADQLFTLQVLPKVSPPAGLIGWWRAENDALDAAGTNQGVLVNGATFTSGKVGQAFSLDGVDDYIEIGDAPALRPASVTLEAWVKFFSSGGVQQIMGKTLGNGTANSFAVWLENGNLFGTIADSSGAGSPVGVAFTPVLGRWYHIAFTFDNATKQQWLYLDGIPVATRISNRLIGYDDHPILLGADIENGGQGLVLYGRIDEAAIYNRALGPTEIASVYRAGPVGKTAVGPYINTPPVLPDGGVGQAYSQTITSVQGTAPVAYTLVGGALPGNLTLSPDGVLSGVPAHSGAFDFVVRTTDAAGLNGDQAFELGIVAPIPPPAGLVGWWRAEGNAQDSAGTNHGILNNGATYVAGKAGQAFLLDGINDFIQIADAPELRPASITLETWVQFNAGGARVILGKPVGNSIGDSYAIYLGGDTLAAFVGDAEGPGTQLAIPFSPVLGQWYYVAYTFDDVTRQQVLYLDGVTVASGLGTKAIGYDTHPLLLGCDIDNGGRAYFLSGRIDEPAIYSRALSANEIAAIHHAGPAGKLSSAVTQPSLRVRLTSTNSVILSWPSSATNFQLQQNTNLSTHNWVAPPESINEDGPDQFIIVSPPTGTRYYRLFKP